MVILNVQKDEHIWIHTCCNDNYTISARSVRGINAQIGQQTEDIIRTFDVNRAEFVQELNPPVIKLAHQQRYVQRKQYIL